MIINEPGSRGMIWARRLHIGMRGYCRGVQGRCWHATENTWAVGSDLALVLVAEMRQLRELLRRSLVLLGLTRWSPHMRKRMGRWNIKLALMSSARLLNRSRLTCRMLVSIIVVVTSSLVVIVPPIGCAPSPTIRW